MSSEVGREGLVTVKSSFWRTTTCVVMLIVLSVAGAGCAPTSSAEDLDEQRIALYIDVIGSTVASAGADRIASMPLVGDPDAYEGANAIAALGERGYDGLASEERERLSGLVRTWSTSEGLHSSVMPIFVADSVLAANALTHTFDPQASETLREVVAEQLADDTIVDGWVPGFAYKLMHVASAIGYDVGAVAAYNERGRASAVSAACEEPGGLDVWMARAVYGLDVGCNGAPAQKSGFIEAIGGLRKDVESSDSLDFVVCLESAKTAQAAAELYPNDDAVSEAVRGLASAFPSPLNMEHLALPVSPCAVGVRQLSDGSGVGIDLGDNLVDYLTLMTESGGEPSDSALTSREFVDLFEAARLEGFAMPELAARAGEISDGERAVLSSIPGTPYEPLSDVKLLTLAEGDSLSDAYYVSSALAAEGSAVCEIQSVETIVERLLKRSGEFNQASDGLLVLTLAGATRVADECGFEGSGGRQTYLDVSERWRESPATLEELWLGVQVACYLEPESVGQFDGSLESLAGDYSSLDEMLSLDGLIRPTALRQFEELSSIDAAACEAAGRLR